MHVGGISADLNWFLHVIFTLFLAAIGFLYLVKNTASRYFEVDANFEGGGAGGRAVVDRATPESPMEVEDAAASVCANCGISGSKICSRCKSVRYCSSACQEAHWKSGHKLKCKDLSKVNARRTARTGFGLKASGAGGKNFSGVALVPVSGTSKFTKKPRKILFPYDEFIKLYKWNKPGFVPCGLLNCGNSCFANVVLQCLTYTRPLVAYLLEKGHQRECRRNDWCFLCAFETHVQRASQSSLPFSPINILSRLPNIGSNLGYGSQEDAHEFMRFAIDTMQSVCLDEFGGEKAVEPSSQETTLIQHTFGGHLQSEVFCTKCNKISNQLENMMDLTVEIHGDAASLEDCLDQFTAKEWLHGENMYKCDGCNEYVKAWKRLTIQRPPNILTIALKRFQSGRFGKLNKRVSFPETLDLSPYMSKEGDGTDVYKLYAVVVHVDMLNASFFGHYICYTKDFCGNWYRIDDCKVASVELEEVLSQGAYMLLYSRVSVRPSCLRTIEPSKEEQHLKVKMELDSCTEEKTTLKLTNAVSTSCSPVADHNSEITSKEFGEAGTVSIDCRSAILKDVFSSANKSFAEVKNEAVADEEVKGEFHSELDSSSIKKFSSCDKYASILSRSGTLVDDVGVLNSVDNKLRKPIPMEVSYSENDSPDATDSRDIMKEDTRDLVNSDSTSSTLKNIEVYDSGN